MTHKNLTALGLLAAGLAAAGCGNTPDAPKAQPPAATKAGDQGDHGDGGDHGAGPHGGTVIEFGKYHGEFCVDHARKQATVYVLDGSVKNAAPVAAETLSLSVKTPQFQVELKADPQPGDPKGKSSRFVATHENFAKEQEFEGTLSGLIDGKPYSGDFKEEPHADPKKGSKAAGEVDAHGRAVAQGNAAEAEVCLKPGGIYTDADIKANGGTTVSAKYKDLKVSHDIKPKAGDQLCPVTLTKANPALTWVIGGRKYEFCCPPCVEEFVTLAKTKPGEVKAPEAYLKP